MASLAEIRAKARNQWKTIPKVVPQELKAITQYTHHWNIDEGTSQLYLRFLPDSQIQITRSFG